MIRRLTDSEHVDRAAAAALTTAFHLLLGWIALTQELSRGSSVHSMGQSTGLYVEFVSIANSEAAASDANPLPSSMNARQPNREEEPLLPTPIDSLTDDETAHTQEQLENDLAQSESPDVAPATQKTGQGIKGEVSAPLDFSLLTYHAAIRQRIKEVHMSYFGKEISSVCEIRLHLSPGGAVLEADVLGCNADPEAVKQIAAAALMAQPLPYEGFESVFNENISLGFSPHE